MMSVPYVIRELASKAPTYSVEQKTSYRELASMRCSDGDVMEMLLQRATSQIAREFSAKLYKHLTLTRREEPDGHVISAHAVALRHDELVELLYAAYREGQTDGMRRDFNPNFVG
jgi:hypothetical protein